MATVTLSRCQGGGHAHITVHDAGNPDYTIVVDTQNIMERRYSVLSKMELADADLLRQIIDVVRAVSEPRTVLKIKNAVEGATYTLTDRTG
jgi:hypothetical protein